MSASLSNDEIEDKYFLLSQVEILGILNDLAHRREGVTVYFNSGQHFILTAILSARPEGLVFDLGGDPKSNRLLEKAQQCVFIAKPDGIRVQFTGQNPQRFLWGENEAFWVPLPDRVIRLQRRESYRILVPGSARIRVKLSDIDAKLIAEWPVHDLSVSGFGMIVDQAPPFSIGDEIPQAWLTLPNNLNVHSPVIVRHISFLGQARSGKYQVGFSFIDLPHNMDVAIQKTILNIEYERHRLLGK